MLKCQKKKKEEEEDIDTNLYKSSSSYNNMKNISNNNIYNFEVAKPCNDIVIGEKSRFGTNVINIPVIFNINAKNDLDNKICKTLATQPKINNKSCKEIQEMFHKKHKILSDKDITENYTIWINGLINNNKSEYENLVEYTLYRKYTEDYFTENYMMFILEIKRNKANILYREFLNQDCKY